MHQIHNEKLTARINPIGAELVSLWNQQQKRELIWQGDPAIWAKHSPILFPVVGKVLGDQYRLGQAVHPMPKHGFASDSVFSLSQQAMDTITLSLTSTSQTMEMYPFPFLLEVTFTLQGNTLKIIHTVHNPSVSQSLPFSIGAHPGFCCAIGDQLIFEKEEKPEACRLDGDFLLNPVPEPIAMDGTALEITQELFVNDALIFPSLCSQSVILRSKTLGDVLQVHWHDAPVLGVWAKPGAPYVCVEPWYGIDDHADVSEQLTEKPRIILLPPGQSFAFPITITVL